MATPNGSSRCTSNEYCCTRGERAFGSMMERLCPMPVRSPSVLPVGLARPLGNGLVRLLAGVALLGRHVRRCRRVPRRVVWRADGELRRPVQAVTAADGGLGRHLPGYANT